MIDPSIHRAPGCWPVPAEQSLHLVRNSDQPHAFVYVAGGAPYDWSGATARVVFYSQDEDFPDAVVTDVASANGQVTFGTIGTPTAGQYVINTTPALTRLVNQGCCAKFKAFFIVAGKTTCLLEGRTTFDPDPHAGCFAVVIASIGPAGPLGPVGPLAASVLDAAHLTAILPAALKFPIGALAYVQILDNYYKYLPNDTRAPDGVNIIAAGDGGNWVVFQLAVVVPRALAPQTVVDPSNISGHANDLGPGTSAAPLLTTAELNRRLVTTIPSSNGAQIDLTVTWLGDQLAGDAPLDMSQLRGTSLIIEIFGTPTVLHSGTLTSGTIAINPSASGGGQAQVLEDTALGINGWAPYVGYYARIVGGPRAGTTVYITKSLPGTSSAKVARPTSAGFAAGSMLSGDSYQIVRPTNLTFGHISPQTQGSYIEFTDFTYNEPNPSTFGIGSTFISNGNVFFMNRCTAGGSLVADSIQLFNCWTVGITATRVTMQGGVYLTTQTSQIGLLALSSDVYITNDGLLLGPSNIQAITFSPGYGAGVQFQDCAASAISVFAGTVATSIDPNNHPLLWGTGNGFGNGLTAVFVYPGSHFVVQQSVPPTVTGPNGDWQVGVYNTACRAWNEATGLYTNQIATRTWANFYAAIGSGGFGGNAHILGLDSHMVASDT